MKVIDLYNMAVQGEIPKKIKMYDNIFIYDEYKEDWINGDNKGILDLKNTIDGLTHTVEIIEEEKDIEEMTLCGKPIAYGVMSEWLDFTPNDNEQKICSAIETIGIKVNEIVKKINKLKNK